MWCQESALEWGCPAELEVRVLGCLNRSDILVACRREIVGVRPAIGAAPVMERSLVC
jgi:hypothetical protein